MKKTAIILGLCMILSLVSCGADEEAESSKPLNIQQATVSDEEIAEENSDDDIEEETTTEHSTKRTSKYIRVTTAPNDDSTETRTGTATIAKRTTAAAPGVSPSRNTGRIPTASNTKKTTTTQSTTTTTIKPHFGFRNGDISCLIKDDGIEVNIKGESKQILAVDTASMLEYYQTEDYHNGKAEKSKLINIIDFDFDGYPDLYIPQYIGTPNSFGIYVHYNPDTKEFEKWEELVDMKLYFNINEDKTLTNHCRISAFEYEQKTYQWNDKKELEIIKLKRQYRPEDSEEVFIDYFEYPDNIETLVRREKLILDDENNIIDTEEIPINQEISTTTIPTTTETTATTTMTTELTTTIEETTTESEEL